MSRWVRGALLAALAVPAAARASDFGGEIELRADGYPEGEPALQGWFQGVVTYSAHPASWCFVRIGLLVEADTHGDISRDDLYQDDDRNILRSPTRFRDLLVGFRRSGVTLELGKQRLTWARATFINATDNLTPRDWTDPLNEERLSPWAARLTVERGRFAGEVVLVPRYAPSRLPVLGERWFPVEPSTVGGFAVEASWGQDAFPPVTWSTLQGAARFSYRGAHGEGSISWFRGYDDAPVVTPVLGTPDPIAGTIPVALDRSAARLEVTGADGEVLVGSWVLRGEAGYFHYGADEVDGYALYQVEAQWTRGSWQAIVGWGDSIGGEPSEATPTALDLGYLPAAFVRVTYGEATGWNVAADAVIGAQDVDAFVRLSGSYPFAGHYRVGGEVDLIRGDAGTFFGRWADNDRATVFVRGAW